MFDSLGFDTRCVRAGEGPSPQYRAHTTPIYQTSTFEFDSAEQAAAVFSGKEAGYKYIRMAPNTPTHQAFVQKLAAEGVKAGASGPQRVRFVTHYGVTADDVRKAVQACRRALAA